MAIEPIHIETEKLDPRTHWIVSFTDKASNRRCALIRWGDGRDWILSLHPSNGHWVTWREATVVDRNILKEAMRESKLHKETRDNNPPVL